MKTNHASFGTIVIIWQILKYKSKNIYRNFQKYIMVPEIFLLSICGFLKYTFFSHFQICIYTNYIIFSLFWGLFYPTRRLGLSTVSRNPKNLQNMKNFVKKMNFSYFFLNKNCLIKRVFISVFSSSSKSLIQIFSPPEKTRHFFILRLFLLRKNRKVKWTFPVFA